MEIKKKQLFDGEGAGCEMMDIHKIPYTLQD